MRLEDLKVNSVVLGILPNSIVTVTKNEILTNLNRPDAFILAIVSVVSGVAETPAYLRQPFTQEPEFGIASVSFKLAELLEKAAAQQAKIQNG
ncbi:MAG: DUF3883 domain-containing protein [Verrucomicrobiales bacterium]|jgi:hypothetical protein|nr:DUF3883 domain-containing protein [Verrucomicrobiales bacterium]